MPEADVEPELLADPAAHCEALPIGVDSDHPRPGAGEIEAQRAEPAAEVGDVEAMERVALDPALDEVEQELGPLRHEGRVGVQRAQAGRVVDRLATLAVVLDDLAAKHPLDGCEVSVALHSGMMTEMRATWSTIVLPLLEASQPKRVVEAGEESEMGDLLVPAAAKLGASVVGLTEAERTSEPAELALVHGEPNWHSVSAALERLADLAAAAGAPLPATVVHGVDWPTGRRDAYPDPAAIPVGSRQPHAFDGGLARALDEHDLRNGVMTAVEDFLAGHDGVEMVHVPGLGGTAILVPAERLKGRGSAPLSRLLGRLRLSPEALAQFAAVEAERVRADAHSAELLDELEAARSGIDARRSAEAATLRARIDELASGLAEMKEALARRDARLAILEANNDLAAGAASTHSFSTPPPALGGPADPLPLDRRGILLGPDEEASSAEEIVDVVVRMVGEAAALRRCIWSLLASADRPLRLTLQLSEDSGEEARELARAIAEAEAGATLAEGEELPAADCSRLWIGSPGELARETFHNLIAATSREGRAAAALSGGAAGIPAWAGEDCVSPLLGARTLDASEAPSLAAACVAFPPGVSTDPTRLIALDAPVADGSAPAPAPPEALAPLTAALADEPALARALRERLPSPPAIAYILPGLPAEGSGGSHSVFQEAVAMRSIGVRARVLVAADFAERAASLYPEAADLVHPYASPRALTSGLAGFDVAVATEAPTARLVEEHVRAEERVLGAYYVQDYEPLFSPAGGPSADAALLSYRQAEGLLLFAKSHWIANVVGAAHDLPVAKVSPSLDQTLFHAVGRPTGRTEAVRVLAMIRPRTPRRRPLETLTTLASLKRLLGDRVECLGFGCGLDELSSLPAAKDVEHLGVLERAEVAEVLRRSDVFLDLSEYQAFGRTGLEAMACGAVPVLPAVGGVHEYAVDGHNSLVVDTGDEAAVLDAVAALIDDPERLASLRRHGTDTGRSYSLTKAAISQCILFAAALRAKRGQQ